ncbi:MAG TPA: amino acid ABC transporter permease, partial [Clostridium sp.]|nr:amino acid ABC transporter permease [Clostridium sp.]
MRQFLLIYLLLIVVALIMRKCKIDQTKLLILASIKMTVQLVLAGLILTYIFQNPHP